MMILAHFICSGRLRSVLLLFLASDTDVLQKLLRLKCSAYSTLNEEDEDPADETRVNEIFTKAHSHSPTNELLDPAALYLTAIIELVCPFNSLFPSVDVSFCRSMCE